MSSFHNYHHLSHICGKATLKRAFQLKKELWCYSTLKRLKLDLRALKTLTKSQGLKLKWSLKLNSSIFHFKHIGLQSKEKAFPQNSGEVLPAMVLAQG